MKVKKFVLLIILGITFTSCFSSNKENNLAVTEKIAFFIYIAADNDLGEAALNDLKEIADADTQNIDVVVFFDTDDDIIKGSYYLKKTNSENDKFLGISKLKVLSEIGEVNTGDSLTLKTFLDYSQNNYPADKYIVSIWSHGDGWSGDSGLSQSKKG